MYLNVPKCTYKVLKRLETFVWKWKIDDINYYWLLSKINNNFEILSNTYNQFCELYN